MITENRFILEYEILLCTLNEMLNMTCKPKVDFLSASESDAEKK